MKRDRDWKGQEVSTIPKKKMSDAIGIENWPKDTYKQAFHQRAAVALETLKETNSPGNWRNNN